MKKLNQKSINKIIFSKLFENTNNTFQDVRIDSSKMNVSSMSGMNEPPQRVVPTKLQVRQDPKKPGKPEDMEEIKTPEENWDDRFSKDNFYKMWKNFWEQQFGKGLEKLMNEEFERIIDLMRWKFLKLVTDRPGYGGLNTPGMGADDAFQEAIRLFISYFQQPTQA